VIYTAALEMIAGSSGDIKAQSRKPEIVADAAYIILTRESRSFTGKFAVDEDVLKEQGVQDFRPYNYVESEIAHEIHTPSPVLTRTHTPCQRDLKYICYSEVSMVMSMIGNYLFLGTY
jgi:hypothetical protein